MQFIYTSIYLQFSFLIKDVETTSCTIPTEKSSSYHSQVPLWPERSDLKAELYTHTRTEITDI